MRTTVCRFFTHKWGYFILATSTVALKSMKGIWKILNASLCVPLVVAVSAAGPVVTETVVAEGAAGPDEVLTAIAC
ncbi:hypothetical protein ACQ86N_20225 [Puia sp. P3]|uniref:hypothetical protein n=1 Tax=Puia sp. P3 TaxID=3423952 RepID=UPI003D667012